METEYVLILSYSQMWASRFIRLWLNCWRCVISDAAVTAPADKHPLPFMNEGLVGKCQEGRQNMIEKHFGTARILAVEDALRKEQQAMNSTGLSRLCKDGLEGVPNGERCV